MAERIQTHLISEGQKNNKNTNSIKNMKENVKLELRPHHKDV
jgi:hypothetical protein